MDLLNSIYSDEKGQQFYNCSAGMTDIITITARILEVAFIVEVCLNYRQMVVEEGRIWDLSTQFN